MAEKIIIDIELKGIGDAQKGLDDLTKLQITQQDAIKKTQQEIKDYEKSLKDLSNAQKEGKTLTETDIALQKVMTQNLEATKVSLAEQKDELSKTNTERRGAIKATENYNTALNAEMGSNEQLKAQLAVLTAEYNKMSASERESTDAGKNLTTGIKGITDKLKENEKAVGDNKRNVGNYEEAVTNALGKVSIFGVNLGGVTRNIQAGIAKGQGLVKTTLAQAKAASVSATATTAQGTATAGASVASGGLTAALKIVKIALISTGIAAIVVLLGSLVGAFASTQRGSDAFSKVLTPLKFIIQGILGVLQDLSFILVDKVMATFNEFKSANIGDIFKKIGDAIVTNVTNRINSIGIAGKAIVKILSGDFKEGFKELADAGIQATTGITNGTDKLSKGVELAKDGFDILKDKIKQSADEGTRYKEMTIAMELAQIRLATAIAISNRDMKEAMLISY